MHRLLKGVIAGAVGTAAMTAHQELRSRMSDADDEKSGQGDPWDCAPAPAQVAKRGLDAAGLGPVAPRAIPLLTQVMHWSYGSLWGGAYALAAPSSRFRGPLFGLVVWASSYAQLVPLGVYEEPWHYPPSAIAEEVAYHVTYGTGVALAFSALRSRG